MWQLQWDELEIERQVGRGSFGAVYRARWHETSVAVKVLIDRGALVTCETVASNFLVQPAAVIKPAKPCVRQRTRLLPHSLCVALSPPAADTPLPSAGLELPDETMRELEAEAAVMIRMRHPNVVQVGRLVGGRA